MNKNGISEYFEEVELTKEYDGYFCKIESIITIIILGSMCGLKNVSQIYLWASNKKNSEFLKEKFGIEKVPCYYWMLCLLKLIKPESLNQCFMKWIKDVMSQISGTVSIDGKTVRSTKKMKQYEKPLHIISAQLTEAGLTFAQNSTDGKGNEIPAVRELLEMLEIKGCMIVADAMHCQKETASCIIQKEADYLLCVKGNQKTLYQDIADYIQDKELRTEMKKVSVTEKDRCRMEIRTAFVTDDTAWMSQKKEWTALQCIGAVRTKIVTEEHTSETWHYYISSRNLSPEELLHHARMEWTVETMHWILDVHFREDFCRIQDKEVQKNFNMLRKAAINLIKQFRNSHTPKSPLSHIMLNCLIDPDYLFDVFCGE